MEDRITDTIPEEVFDAITRYYSRKGYRLESYLLTTSNTYEATFVKV